MMLIGLVLSVIGCVCLVRLVMVCRLFWCMRMVLVLGLMLILMLLR